jgi:pimeloyl-ACP methyl ester carboxylesterase
MIEKFNTTTEKKGDVAIVFVHGFTGDRRTTWRNIPELLQAEPGLAGWDLFGFGYESKRRFDILKLWSADAKLEEIATALASPPEIGGYARLAFVAHSMGGLVVQRALVKYPDLRRRTSNVILFGTPSAGLVKATLLSAFKQQINNMSASGAFIQSLRRDWNDLKLNADPPFKFLAVAGELDQFVPPESSLEPFPESVQRVIPGNHLSMLDVDSKDAPCIRILVDALTAGASTAGPRTAARLAVERGAFQQTIEQLWPQRTELDDSGAELLALSLDATGRRGEAIEFLQGHTSTNTNVLGVLAGRYKRRWLVERRRADAERALELYRRAYSEATAKQPPDNDQAYYHGINIAHLELAYGGDYHAAREMAQAVLEHCEKAMSAKNEAWRLATEGDALVILGRTQEGFDKHAAAAKQKISPWQALSIQEQAVRTADLCGLGEKDIERLSDLFMGLELLPSQRRELGSRRAPEAEELPGPSGSAGSEASRWAPEAEELPGPSGSAGSEAMENVERIRTITIRVLSAAETDSADGKPHAVYIYGDGKGGRKQVTLGIGFTEDGGNLYPVIERYVTKKGVFADHLATYLPQIGKGTLAADKKFHELLKQAGARDPLMAEAQNEQFNKSYLDPAFAWFKKHGFDTPLAFLVIADSYLHSGGIRDALRNSFKESTPAQGGNEKVWVRSYVEARHNWLANHSNKLLRNTVYRTQCFRNELARENWMLEQLPIVMNGVGVDLPGSPSGRIA